MIAQQLGPHYPCGRLGSVPSLDLGLTSLLWTANLGWEFYFFLSFSCLSNFPQQQDIRFSTFAHTNNAMVHLNKQNVQLVMVTLVLYTTVREEAE